MGRGLKCRDLWVAYALLDVGYNGLVGCGAYMKGEDIDLWRSARRSLFQLKERIYEEALTQLREDEDETSG